jgi:DNA-binding MarR family transcriptional regulator
MDTDITLSHSLDGFPAAAVAFVSAMQRRRALLETQTGLSATELRALFRVAAAVRATPKELARHLDMTTAAITFISTRLVERGLIQRVDHPTDRRSLFLELTPSAHQLMHGLHSEFDAMLEGATGNLTESGRSALTATLLSLAASIDDQPRPAPVAVIRPG